MKYLILVLILSSCASRGALILDNCKTQNDFYKTYTMCVKVWEKDK